LKYNLEAEGYEIVTATNASQGIKLAESRPDLIILEAMLPNNEDGWEFICKLRQMESTKLIPLICVTTTTDEKDNPCGTACGVNEYLIKPISLRHLLARVKTLLQN
jgi:DNA-binding response OmpR family regulator